MVYKIMQTKYKVFIESLVITLLILLIGFALGMYIESYRTNKIIEKYKDYEIEALDLKLQNYYYQIMSQSSCQQAIEQNFIFADDLYTQGLKLEKYEEASQISDEISREKKRYSLLKTELWLNSILLKEKCNHPFDTVVYIYSADPSNSIKVAQQKVISNILKTVKENRGNSIILLPIAGDLNLRKEDENIKLGSINLQMKIYNITNLPSIIINEKVILEGFHTIDEIENYLNKENLINPSEDNTKKIVLTKKNS